MKGTIKSNDDVERLFHSGRRSSSYLMTVLVLERTGTDHAGRCAYIAGRKLGSAPLRSRCKRVLREAAREIGAPWNGYDVAFVARRGVATAKHEDVVRALRRAVEKLGLS